MKLARVAVLNCWSWLRTHFSVVWGVTTLLAVIAFGWLGFYAQRELNRDFIGERTKLIQRCRKDPKHNRKLCEDLFKERGEDGDPKSTKTLRSPQRPPFLLSEGNADLTPSS